MSRVLKILALAVGWTAFVYFASLIIQNSLPYFTGYEDAAFIVEKGGVAHSPLWRVMLLVHIAGGFITLCSVLLQFSRGLLKRFPWLHRWLGRIYAWSLLGPVLIPGFYLAYYANGGLSGQIGFLLNGLLAGWFTIAGLRTLRTSGPMTHARWMVRSFSMVASAITFRLWHLAFYYVGFTEATNYQLSLWCATLGNVLLAEALLLVIFSRFSRPGDGPSEKHNPQPATLTAA